MQVDMHEAKSRLSQLGKLAWDGEEIIIAKSGTPYLHLTPYREETGDRNLGLLKGQIRMAPDFDETSEDILRAFEGDFEDE